MKIIASVLLLLAIGLSGCQTPSQKEKEKKAALKKKTKAELREESSDVDFQAFVGRLRKAVAAHDVNTLAELSDWKTAVFDCHGKQPSRLFDRPEACLPQQTRRLFSLQIIDRAPIARSDRRDCLFPRPSARRVIDLFLSSPKNIARTQMTRSFPPVARAFHQFAELLLRLSIIETLRP